MSCKIDDELTRRNICNIFYEISPTTSTDSQYSCHVRVSESTAKSFRLSPTLRIRRQERFSVLIDIKSYTLPFKESHVIVKKITYPLDNLFSHFCGFTCKPQFEILYTCAFSLCVCVY